MVGVNRTALILVCVTIGLVGGSGILAPNARAAPGPTLSIVAPANNAIVGNGSPVAIVFAVTNFNLTEPDAGPSTPDSGHAAVFVDGGFAETSSTNTVVIPLPSGPRTTRRGELFRAHGRRASAPEPQGRPPHPDVGTHRQRRPVPDPRRRRELAYQRPGARRPSPAVRRDPVLRPRERPPWPRDRRGDLSQAGGELMARGAWAIAIPLVLLSSLFGLTMEVRAAGPSLSILSPSNDQVIGNGTAVIVRFAVSNFALVQPGRVGQTVNPTEGHVDMYVDGAYSRLLTRVEPISLSLPSGPHVIRLQLVQSDGSPLA